eukprot:gene15728-21849_t
MKLASEKISSDSGYGSDPGHLLTTVRREASIEGQASIKARAAYPGQIDQLRTTVLALSPAHAQKPGIDGFAFRNPLQKSATVTDLESRAQCMAERSDKKDPSPAPHQAPIIQQKPALASLRCLSWERVSMMVDRDALKNASDAL